MSPKESTEAKNEASHEEIISKTRAFVNSLHDFVRSLSDSDTKDIYDTRSKQLTEKYFSQTSWASLQELELNFSDHFFDCLYKEFCHRHSYTRLKPSISDMIEAWYNYCELFQIIIDCKDVDIQITPQWAFDIVHEFVYQFQAFCQFRTQLTSRAPEDIEKLRQHQDVWLVQTVLYYLHEIIRVSRVSETTSVYSQKSKHTSSSAPQSPSKFHYLVGYFSLVGLSRLECLLGDYYSAIEAVESIDVSDEDSLLSSNLSCRVNVAYHLGFSYLMLRRYRDVIKVFSDTIVYISKMLRNNSLSQRKILGSSVADQAQKLNDKMSALLVISLVLCPGIRVDGSVFGLIPDKHREHMKQMRHGDQSVFYDLFKYACPKFIVPSIPNYDSTVDISQQIYDSQVHLFIDDISQFVQMPKVNSYLKLYSSIPLDKLSRFNDTTPEAIRAELMAFKHRARQQLEPNTYSNVHTEKVLDVRFFVEDSMVHIEDAERVPHHENFFLNQLRSCERIMKKTNEMK